RLAQVLAGRDRPSGPAEGAALAPLAYLLGPHGAAARLYAAAVAAEAALGEERQASPRYKAAGARARGGAGHAADEPKPDDAARSKLRGQAMDWLKAERAAWAKVLETGDPKARAAVAPMLRHWQKDPDLAGIRDDEGLAKLPEAERVAFRELWADVD